MDTQISNQHGAHGDGAVRCTDWLDAIVCGDCLNEMPKMPAQSVDAIISDLPYGTTACKWDSVIPFAHLWSEWKRLLKPNGVIVLTASQPFTSALVMSNPDWFKCEWIWRKNTGSGFAYAKHQPMRYHESVLVFSNGRGTYNPQRAERFSEASKRMCRNPIRGGGKRTSEHAPMNIVMVQYDSETKGPESVLEFKSVPNSGGGKLHPTQKPAELMRYLVRTYTNHGDVILDPCCGSGTTCLAALEEGRHYIGIEKEQQYVEIAKQRTAGARGLGV